MTVSSAIRKAGPFAGNNVATTFPFNFKVFAKGDIKVLRANPQGVATQLTLDSDYSVQLNTNQNDQPGGWVTYPISGAALPTGYQLVMLGDLAYDQETDITNGGGFYPNTIEDMSDRSTIQIQQLAEIASRAITIPEVESTSPILPNATARAGTVMGFDVNGGLTLLPMPSSLGAGDLRLDTFSVGTDFTPNVTTQLTLSRAPISKGNCWVYWDGTPQLDFTLSGNTLLFPTPIPDGISHVYARIGSTLSLNAPAPGSVTDDSVAPGSKLYVRIHDEVHATDYGAKFDGVTDDTVCIQKAIDAAGVNGSVFFPNGTTVLSATLNGYSGQSWTSHARGSVCFRRFTDYGDTVKFANAVSIVVRGIYMFHGTKMLTPGDIALTDRVTSDTAHIRLQNAQGVVIEDCILWRMPRQIVIDQGSLVWINRCNAQGTWDGQFSAAQEGRSAIQIGAVGYTQIVKITDCYFGGSGNGPRNVTFTSSDTGAHTFSLIQDVGNQFAIEIDQCEDLLVADNYMGGNWNSCIFANLVGGSVNLDWRFTGNFIDGAGAAGALMTFGTQVDGTFATGVVISDNVFNGEMQTLNGIVAFNAFGSQPVLTDFNISNNVSQAIVGSMLMLYHAHGGKVSDNTFTAYNARNCSAGLDLAFSCAAYAGPATANISFDNNHCGGSVNTADAPSFCYQHISYDTAPGSVSARGTYVVGGGLNGTWVGRVDKRVVTVTAGNYSMTGNEDLVVVNKAVGATTQITPPPNAPVGASFKFKDGKGDAATNPIQIIALVDNANNPAYSTNYVFHELTLTGTQWNITG